jgi:hypothetical protein
MISSRALLFSLLALALLCSAQTARAWSPCADPGPFTQDGVGLTLSAGSSFAGKRNYLILGVGAGYYLLDGFELGLDVAFWVANDPFAVTFTPHLNYVVYFVPVLRPYVGTFLRQYVIAEGFDDMTSVGLRFGLAVTANPRLAVSLGGVYEYRFVCDDELYTCEDMYPELTVTFAF